MSNEYEPWYYDEKPLQTVYVATQGEYSDHRVVGVFTTEELANQNGDDSEAWALLDRAPRRAICYNFSCHITTNGDVVNEQLHSYMENEHDPNWGKSVWERVVAPPYPHSDLCYVRVRGYNQAMVAKVFYDLVAHEQARIVGIAD